MIYIYTKKELKGLVLYYIIMCSVELNDDVWGVIKKFMITWKRPHKYFMDIPEEFVEHQEEITDRVTYFFDDFYDKFGLGSFPAQYEFIYNKKNQLTQISMGDNDNKNMSAGMLRFGGTWDNETFEEHIEDEILRAIDEEFEINYY